ncbi:hypothetical protein CYMTET_38176, partial [Cymbomonas tetramitiformis]
EAMNINTSLLAIGNVVQALASQAKHIPFRDSNLTRLLEGSLGGHCRTCLLVCISAEPHSSAETQSTLEFAHRAIRIETQVTVHEETVHLDSPLVEDLASSIDQALEEVERIRQMDGEKVKELQKTLAEAEHQREATSTRAKEIETLATKMNEMLGAKTEEAEKLESQTERLEKELAKVRAELEETEAKLKESHKSLFAHDIAKQKLVIEHEREISELKAENERERQQYMAAAERAQSASCELQVTQSELNNVIAQKTEVELQINANMNTLATIRTQLDEKEGDVDELKRRESALVQQQLELEQQVLQTEKELAKIREAHAVRALKWEAERATLAGVLNNMQELMTEQTSEMRSAEDRYESTVTHMAQKAAEQIAELETQLANARNRAGQSESNLAAALEHEERKVSAMHREMRAAEAKAAEDIAVISKAAEKLEEELRSERAELEAGQRRIDEGQAALALEAQRGLQLRTALLKSGALFKKDPSSGRHMTSRWRHVRMSEDMAGIEWIHISDKAHQMTAKGGSLTWTPQKGAEDQITIEGSRKLMLQVFSDHQREWVSALEKHLKGVPVADPASPERPVVPALSVIASTPSDAAKEIAGISRSNPTFEEPAAELAPESQMS